MPIPPKQASTPPRESINFPIAPGFAGSGKNMLTKKILDYAKPFLFDYKDPYTDQAYIRGLVDEYERTGINFSTQIWTLINFKMWHKFWIAGESIS